MIEMFKRIEGVGRKTRAFISWKIFDELTLRSGDTLTNDRIERWCYC